MTRFAFIGVVTVIVVLIVLGIANIKNTYKLLPIQATQQFIKTPYEEWQEFDSPSGTFQVKLPTLPQRATQTIKDPKSQTIRQYDMYVAQQNNNTTYMISAVRYINNKESPETLQKSMISDLLASNPSNQLKTMSAGSYKQFPTIDFTITNDTNTIDGMTFMDGETLYILSTIFSNQRYNPEDYQFFVKSFDLTNKLEEAK